MTQSHKTEPIFVGRRDELKRFGEVLASPKGQGVLVVGPQGMGKTLLVNRMARIAQTHPDLACDHVRFEVTDTDEPDAVMELMIDRAFDAAGQESSVGGGERRTRQYLALLKLLPKGDALGDLIQSLRRDPKKNARQQLGEKLECISRRMKKNARAIFVIDPEKYMTARSADAWRLVVDNLPDRIIFLFAQRPDDALAKSAEFGALSNVVRIPDGPLDALDEHEVDDLVQARTADLSQPGTDARVDVRAALARYNGHPYAVAAALGLLADGAAIADLPADPTATGVAEAQWRRLCDEHKENAIKLFEAYAVLEVAVPDDVVETVSGVDTSVRKSLAANAFVAGLLRSEPDGTRIYHSLLADHIHGQISASDARAYHTFAIKVYRRRLTVDVRPDGLAAVRLPEHVLAGEGPKQFVRSLANECFGPLLNLGLFDVALALSHRALKQYVSPGSEEEGATAGNLGLVFKRRGDLDEAEKMFLKALRIDEKLGCLEGMAAAYGNLGLISKTRGDLDEAENMHRKALEIEKKVGRLEGMANQYGNLGLVFKERGELDDAEKMHRKSLKIEKRLGRLEGMASTYGNLGIIFRTRGDLDEAEKMFHRALEIDEKLGQLESMGNAYGNLGNIFRTRGDLNEAENMYRKSLVINEELGRLEGMAGNYGNLGLIFETRGELDEARKLGTKAVDLYARIGMPHMVEQVQGWLDGLPDADKDRS